MFIIARTAKQRPTLMHYLSGGTYTSNYTACGLNIQGWSRAYFNEPISQVLCKRCKAAVFPEAHS